MPGRSPRRDRSAQPRANGMTQPALSSGISRLEKHLDRRLFYRSPRGIAPHRCQPTLVWCGHRRLRWPEGGLRRGTGSG
ncbi:helix-turn-helix domain-containing protein [Arachnia propionica]|uniref:helix-turn-helix domain-containing protein n=1 Tax=Arachnia propionica TaxID=1750 RepID=UPI003C6C594B